ncbi:MAG TPA: hypothetical protein ENN49_01675 [Bacteroidales bacterium]|nr:hypothetical protein [Bacteroidales bacterium]
MPYRISSSYTEASDYKGPILSYDKQPIPGSISICPSSLLFDKAITSFPLEIGEWHGMPAFPITSSNHKSDIPFDLLAGAFYLVTRYEEYLPHKPDKHGRFRFTNSIAYKNGFLEIPIIDIWAHQLAAAIKEKFGNSHSKHRSFTSQVTFDLDSAFAFKGKSIVRNVLGFAKSALSLEFSNAKMRLMVLTNKAKDPFDIYDELFGILPAGKATKWFIHVGSWGKYDKQVNTRSASFLNVINKLSSRYSIGIHPSYKTYLSDEYFRSELTKLVDILGQAVSASRFHYLRQSIPYSYYSLIRAGITQEYSMGYADKPGFRAGTCTPYPFFDLFENTSKNLKIFPFAIMDKSLLNIVRYDPNQALELVNRLVQVVKNVNGNFVSVWHIDYLARNHSDFSLMEILEKTIEMCRNEGKA